jgi:uncharacterized membrane protein YeiH
VILYCLDLISVFAFAFFGAHAGIKQRFGFLGIFACAFLPALGGGTIREMLLGHPPIYFGNYTYGAVVVLAAIFAVNTKHSAKTKQVMYILDTLGMIVFAYFGATAAIHAHLGIVESMTFAAFTACGGGVLCDLLTHQSPHAFHRRFYVMPALFLGGLLWIVEFARLPTYTITLLFIGTFILQLCVSYPYLLKKLFYLFTKKTNGWLKLLWQSLSVTGRG